MHETSMSDELKTPTDPPWASWLGAEVEGLLRDSERLSVIRQYSWKAGPEHAGKAVVLDSVGTGVQRFDLHLRGNEWPASITVLVGSDLTDLTIHSPDGGTKPALLVIDGAAPGDGWLGIGGMRPESLVLTNGARVDLGWLRFEGLVLVASAIKSGSSVSARRVFFQGDVSVGTRIDAQGLAAFAPGTRISGGHAQASIGAQEFRSTDKSPLDVEARLISLFVSFIAPDARIKLGGARLRFQEGIDAVTSSATITGYGKAIIAARALGWSFVPDPRVRPLELDIEWPGELAETRGRIHKLSADRGVLTSDPAIPFIAEEIVTATASDLEGLNLFGLPNSVLRVLDEAARLDPWIPRGLKARRLFAKAERQAERALRHQHGDRFVMADRRRRAFFRRELAQIVGRHHAAGAIQSEFRYQAARARLRARPPMSERLLLGLYSIVGFGERIFRPLLGVAVISFVAAVGLTVGRGFFHHPVGSWPSVWRAWLTLAASPVTFFRLHGVFSTRTLDIHSIAGESAFLIVAIVEVLLLVLAVLAVRRIVRPESR